MMALFFGLQSAQAYSIFGWFAEVYRDAGFDPHTAGLHARRHHRDQHPVQLHRPGPGRAGARTSGCSSRR